MVAPLVLMLAALAIIYIEFRKIVKNANYLNATIVIQLTI